MINHLSSDAENGGNYLKAKSPFPTVDLALII